MASAPSASASSGSKYSAAYNAWGAYTIKVLKLDQQVASEYNAGQIGLTKFDQASSELNAIYETAQDIHMALMYKVLAGGNTAVPPMPPQYVDGIDEIFKDQALKATADQFLPSAETAVDEGYTTENAGEIWLEIDIVIEYE